MNFWVVRVVGCNVNFGGSGGRGYPRIKGSGRYPISKGTEGIYIYIYKI